MGKVLVFTSASGGTGKTLLTANIGAAFAARGKSVLMMDACMGYPALDLAVGVEQSVIYDVMDVVEGGCRISDALLEVPGISDLFLIPAPRNRSPREMPSEKFLKLLGLFRQKFDFILVDLPREECSLTEAVLGDADMIVPVMIGERASVRSTARFLGTLNSGAEIGVIVNKVRTDLVKNGDLLSIEEVMAELHAPLLGAVRFDTDLQIANEEGSPAADGRSSSGRAFGNIAGRILGEDIPVNLRGRH